MIRILLVEDDAAIARFTERLIRNLRSDIEIKHYESAEWALLDLAIGGRYDLIISDWNLEGPRTGGDVIELVRKLPVQPKFLFLTSNERAQALGVPCLEKPARPSVLRAAIAKLLDIDQPKTVREMPLDYTVEAF